MRDNDRDLLAEYGAESFEKLGDAEGESQTAAPSLEGLTPIQLGGEKFFVRPLPDRLAGSLPLLERGPEDSEESYELTLLLGWLKKTRFVVAAQNGVWLERSAARKLFFPALREREAVLAALLRQRLQEKK